MSKRHHPPYTDKEKADILQKAEAKFAEGWSNNKVAKHVGVNPRTLTKWLNKASDDGKTTVPINAERKKAIGNEQKTLHNIAMTIAIEAFIDSVIEIMDDLINDCERLTKRAYVTGFALGALCGSALTLLTRLS